MSLKQKFVCQSSLASRPRFCHNVCSKTVVPSELVAAIAQKAEPSRNKLAQLKKKYGDTVFDSVTVRATLGGMRGTKLLLCETSQVDPIAGLSYRGIPVQKLSQALPKAEAGGQPSMESLLWLLLTGEIPTSNEVEILREELVRRMELPQHVVAAVDALPSIAHPMTQFVVGISACQTQSCFSVSYKAGTLRKDDYWKIVLQDGLTLIAVIPRIAAHIYRRSFLPSNSQKVPPVDPSIDWAANVVHSMGFDSAIMRDVFRLYVLLHADHEGGNVSAHSAHLVGSALTDPFLSFASAMCGLAGPLHGLANQETLRFLRQMVSYFHDKKRAVTNVNVAKYIETEIISKGKVVPGFGHAVLRSTDPRFVLQHEFASKNIRHDELTDFLNICVEVVPDILKATGKVSNPYPNVDAHSGVILSYFGIKEEDFYTVLFGLSRSVGVIAQLVWDRIFSLPIERPKSVDLKSLERLASEHWKQPFLNNHHLK